MADSSAHAEICADAVGDTISPIYVKLLYRYFYLISLYCNNTAFIMLGSGEKGHSESGEKGHFSVRKKGPTHQRLFYSDYWLLATMESSFTGLHS